MADFKLLNYAGANGAARPGILVGEDSIIDLQDALPGKAWAQDQCSSATRADACQYYKEQIAHNDEQKARAGGDANRLTREGQRLRAIYNHRCS